MSVVFSPGFALNEADFNVNNPIILYDNLATIANVTADGSAADYPVSNVANPDTLSEWCGSTTAEQLVTVTISVDRFADAIGIARHNFGTAQIQVSIEGNVGAGWSQIVAPVLFKDDAPKIFRFTKDVYTGLRLRLGAGSAVPRLAVLSVGELLRLPRRIYVGHTPITLGRQRKVINGMSESGNFLGRVVTGGQSSTAVSLKNLDPAWYRERFDPFVLACETLPFFFSWRPDRYPREIGYVWLSGDAIPKNQMSNGMMQVDLSITGVIA